ncbi:MAG: hypothetical protein V3V14_08825, partial [Saprospiraceae bacterium]
QLLKSSVVTSVYEVEAAVDTYAAGKMKYMEEESFKDDRPFEKSFYKGDQTLKGKEVYQYASGSNLPNGSIYYGDKGQLLSTYKFSYVDTLKSKTMAYAGDTDELLRIETFKYDNNGNLVVKSIYNALNQLEKSFLFSHDQYGNENLMIVTDKDDNKIATENYEIIEVDLQKRWLERYGYVNNKLIPNTFYKRSRND